MAKKKIIDGSGKVLFDPADYEGAGLTPEQSAQLDKVATLEQESSKKVDTISMGGVDYKPTNGKVTLPSGGGGGSTTLYPQRGQQEDGAPTNKLLDDELNNIMGCDYASESVKGAFWKCNQGVGNSADASATTNQFSANYEYVRRPIRNGDILYITASGGASSLAWVLTDNNGIIVKACSTLAYYANNERVEATQDGFIIVNNVMANATLKIVRRGVFSDIEADIVRIDTTIVEHDERIENLEAVSVGDFYVPKKIYQPRTQNAYAYPRNCVSPASDDVVFKSNSGTKGYALSGNDMLWVRDAEASTSYNLYKDSEAMEALGTMEVVRFTPSEPVSKYYILPIGDSLMYSAGCTKQGVFNNELSRLFNGVGNAVANGRSNGTMNNIEVIGTLGSEPIKHEGRSGWSTFDYQSRASLNGVTNAFWNPTTSKFDLDYYLSQNGFYSGGVSEDGSNLVVIICLNWNGVNREWSEHKTSYKELLDNIHASHPQAKICMLGMNCPPEHILRTATGGFTIPTANVVKRITIKFEKFLEGLADDNSYLYHIPIMPFYYTDGAYPLGSTWKPNLRVTTPISVYTDYVHPNEMGYGQMADIAYNTLCGMFFHS